MGVQKTTGANHVYKIPSGIRQLVYDSVTRLSQPSLLQGQQLLNDQQR